MPQLSLSVPDVVEWKPALVLLLSDAFTGSRRLVGNITVRVGVQEPLVPKPPEATFVFVDLPNGNHSMTIRSREDEPFYLPVDIPVTLPLSTDKWTAYPDRGLADASEPLDDPGQPAAYRAQRALAALKPSTAYPFPAGTSLARGTVRAGGKPLAGAVVQRGGDNTQSYQTGDDGSFVLYFKQISGRTETLTLTATAAGRPNASATLELIRRLTVSVDLDMGL